MGTTKLNAVINCQKQSRAGDGQVENFKRQTSLPAPLCHVGDALEILNEPT
jgi:hypothetical protein